MASFNTATLRAAADVAPPDLKVEIVPIGSLPFYDGDVEASGMPPAVAELREAIGAAGGLLIASPEYNWSITGVLKNAIDWASRGGTASPVYRKPAAILGAGGRFGTVRAHMHLREVLASNQVDLIGAPQVLIDEPSAHFDDDLRLITASQRDRLARLVEALQTRVLERRIIDTADR